MIQKLNLHARQIYLGEFVTDGVLRVTDPAYDVDIMGVEIRTALPGKWRVILWESEYIPGWGKRFSELFVHAVSLPTFDGSWERVGSAGVDSAHIGIFDSKINEDIHEYYEEPKLFERGVKCCAGFGDGRYNVFAAERDGRVVSVRVRLLTEESVNEHEEHEG